MAGLIQELSDEDLLGELEQGDISSLSDEQLLKELKPKKGGFFETLTKTLVGISPETVREVPGIAASVASTAAFGIPKALVKRFAPQLEEKIFPEQETIAGKGIRVAGEAGAFMFGGAAKLAAKVGSLVPKLAGVGLKAAPGVVSARRKALLIRNSLRATAEGVTFGGTQILGEGEFGEQATQAGILGLISGFASPFGRGVGKIVTGRRKVKAIKAGLKKTPEEVSKSAKIRARKKVLDLERQIQAEQAEAKILSANELKIKIQQTTKDLKDTVKILDEGLTAESEIVAKKFQEELPSIYRANGKIYEKRLDEAANKLIERGEQITFREISSVTDDIVRNMDDALITEGAGRESIQAFKNKYSVKQIGEASKFTRASTGERVGGAIRSNADDAINLQELVQDIRTVRQSLSASAISGAKRFTQEEVSISLFNKSIGDLVKTRSTEFAALQKEYSPIIEAMKASNRIFKPFKGEFETKTAESLLKRFGLGRTGSGEESLIQAIEKGSSFSPGVGSITRAIKQKGQQLIAAKERIQPVLNSIRDEARFLQQAKDKKFAQKILELKRQKEFVSGDFLVKEGLIDNALTKRLAEMGFRKREIDLLLSDQAKKQALIRRLLFIGASALIGRSILSRFGGE